MGIFRRSVKLGVAVARFAAREVREQWDERKAGTDTPPEVRAAMEAQTSKEAVQAQTPAPEISADALDSALSDGSVVLLDCRDQHEWEAGYIAPCVHIPMNDLPERSGELDSKTPIVVYCLHGMRSAEVAWWLRNERGFEDVSSLEGGIVAWYSAMKQHRIVVTRNEDH